MRLGKLAAMPRIVIDQVVPSVDGGGRFAAKRIIGEPVIVEADVFSDGHELLVVTLLWRAADEAEWRRTPMRSLGNDRWQAAILPDRIGRYEFTVEAWADKYASLCRDLDIKRKADATSPSRSLKAGGCLSTPASAPRVTTRPLSGQCSIGSATRPADSAVPFFSAAICAK